MCIDYRELNKVTVKNRYPLPRIDDLFMQLVMLWQARHNTDAQHMTIDTSGQMVMKSKQQLKEEFGIVAKPIATFKS